MCDALREKTSETQALQWLLRHIPLYFTARKPTFPKPLLAPRTRKKESEVAQLCPTLCDPMDSSLHQAWKTTRPFRYDLTQIHYNYRVEVRNRFKGLDLISVPDELWTEVRDIVQETEVKTIPKKKKCKMAV